MPWNEAFEMDEAERLAFGIVFGEFEGGEYDWSNMRFKERK